MNDVSSAARLPPRGHIPPHWELAAPLAASGSSGAVYAAVDRRFPGDAPPQVVARLLNTGAEEPAWLAPLWERAGAMMSTSFPHVSPLLDAGRSEDFVYLVAPRHDVCLASLLTSDAGLPPSLSVAVFEQLLEALAALHRRGLPHGDVRARNVFLDDPKSDRPLAWLADAAVGPLTWWSQGEFLANDARRYFPPEWRGAPRQPTPEADVYALGLTACQLVLGREAIASREEDGTSEVENLAKRLAPRLKDAGAPVRLRRLIAAMLADDPTQRVSDGEAALRRWRAASSAAPRGKLASIALAAALLAGGAAFYAGYREQPKLREQLDTAAQAKGQLEEQLTAAQQRVAELEGMGERQRRSLDDQAALLQAERSERERLAARVAEMEQATVATIVEPTPEEKVSPETIAREHWTAMLAAIQGDDAVERLEQVVDDGMRQQPPEEGKAEYRDYFNRTRQLRGRPHFTAWMREDSQLRDQVVQFLRQPWNDDALHSAQARHAALEEAARQWDDWAEPQSNMTWDGIRVQIDGKAGLTDEARRVLKGWYAAIEEQSARGWTLVLERGECKEGYGVDRIARVYVDGKQQARSNHAWDSPTAHRYTDPKASRLSFAWRPGQTFGLSLEQDGSVYNTDLITVHYETPFGGPLAIWIADRAGATKSELGELMFHVRADRGGRLTPIPGPPDAVLRDLTDAARKLLGDEKAP